MTRWTDQMSITRLTWFTARPRTIALSTLPKLAKAKPGIVAPA